METKSESQGFKTQEVSKIKKNKYLSAEETAAFTSQVSLILEAGIPIYDGIATLAESAADEDAKRAFYAISSTVEDTGSLYKAVLKAGFFPSYMVNMINIGEETGKLDDVLKSLTIYYEREARVKKSIKSAISYPIILLAMMAAVVFLLVKKVLPIFQEIFKNLGSDVSSTGKAMMEVGTIAGTVVFIIIFVIIAIALIVGILYALGFRDALQQVIFKIPGLKSLGNKLSASKFTSVLGMMLSSGYSLEKALELAPSIVTDRETKKKIFKCQELIKSGKNFPDALFEIGMFSGIQTRMINIGFKAGAMDLVMLKLTDVYEQEIDDRIEMLVSIIEPTLVAIMSLIIGGILISVMLPLANIMSSIG